MGKKFKNIKYAEKYLQIAYDLNINLCFCGAHGRAKTSMVREYAERNGFELETIILSRMTPEDMIGLPTTTKMNGKTVTTFSNPDWLVKASDGSSKVIIFFDEFNNAEVDTQASILDLIESRESNGLKLNDSTQIVMAFNPLSIAPNGRPLSKATRDRLCVIPLCDTQSHNDYLNFYENNGMDALVSTCHAMPKLVASYDDEVIEDAYDNAEFTYRSLEKSYKIVDYCYRNKISCEIAAEMVCGYAGEIGEQFTKKLLSEIKLHEASGSLNDRLKDAYTKGGIKAVIELARSENMIDSFDKTAAFFDTLEGIVNPIDWQKAMNNLTTREFSRIYDARKSGR